MVKVKASMPDEFAIPSVEDDIQALIAREQHSMSEVAVDDISFTEDDESDIDPEYEMEDDEDDDEVFTPETDDIAIEDLPPDQELWPTGPTAGQAVAWKLQHGDVYFTSTDLDEHLVWRCLTRAEYRVLMKRLEQSINAGKSQNEANMDNEESITELCLLAPTWKRSDFGSKKAGIPSLISQQVLEASGFTSIDVRQL